MERSIKNAFDGFRGELLGEIRTNYQKRLNEFVYEERNVGINNATAAMIEVGIENEKIIQMLQKYWDLRLSEAKVFVEQQRKK